MDGVDREEADDGTPPLPVGAVARLLGMASSTLRTWDRRYGLGPGGRSGGTHRRYTAENVRRLRLMRDLIGRGSTPAEAAATALDTPADRLPADPPATDAGAGPRAGGPSAGRPPPGRLTLVGGSSAAEPRPPLDGAAAAAVDELAAAILASGLVRMRLAPPAAAPGAPVDATTTAPPAPPAPPAPAHLRGLARAVLELDAPTITELILDSVSRQGVVATWDALIVPVLDGVGRQWARLGSGIEVEHVFSEAVLGVLRHRAIDLGGDSGNRAPVLLACGPEEHHSITLYALAAALAERRVGTRVLGARVPPTALTAAAATAHPAVAFVWSQAPETAVLDLAALTAADPGVRAVVGGPGWDRATLDPAVLFIDDFGRAVDVLAALAG